MSQEMTASKQSRRRSRLAIRLAVWLGLGAALILLGAGTYNLRTQRAQLIEIVNTSADRIVETIRTSTRDAMMRNRADEVHRIIETIGAQQGIDRIRVFDKQGRIQTSTVPTEMGMLVDTDAEACYACHQRDQPLDRLERADRMRIFQGPDDTRVLGVIAPIRNEADCAGAGCHLGPDEQRVLGVLDVRLSLAVVDDDLAASETQMLVGLAGTVVAVLLLAFFLTWSTVLKPVQRLTDAASRVATGDLTATVPQTSSDELGELAATWNAMVDELGRARDQLERSSQILELKVMEKTEELEKTHQHMLLVQKMASLGKLAAIVAHEINNPLAGINTYATLLRKRMASKPGTTALTDEDAAQDTERILRLIEGEAARCGEIVRNLLLFSRTPSARFAPEELPPLLERCVMLVRHQAELAEVEIKLDFDAGLPAIVCDASQVQQMILSLLVNSIEASDGGGVVTVTAFPSPAREMVALRVADTGRGIPEEHIGRIFEPFFTTKEGGNGVGLGLAVVYGILERHSGRFAVESNPGSGTVFTLWLPVRQPARGRDADSRSGEENQ